MELLTCARTGFALFYISLETGVEDCKKNQHNEGQNIRAFQCQGPSVVTVNPLTEFDSSCNTQWHSESRTGKSLHSYPLPVLLSHNFSSSEIRLWLAYTENIGTNNPWSMINCEKYFSQPYWAFQPRWVRPSRIFSLYFCHCLTWSQRPCRLSQHPPHQILIMRWIIKLFANTTSYWGIAHYITISHH